MQKRIVLAADEGKCLTDGTTFARVVYLAVGDEGENWREVYAPDEARAICGVESVEIKNTEKS